MQIEVVKDIKDAVKCDELLTKLICSESKFDKNLKNDYVVNGYFENKYREKNNVLFAAKNNKKEIIGYAYCKIITDDKGPTIFHIALLDGLYVVYI